LRTNIVLDEDLIREAQKLTALPTKKAVVDAALRALIRLKKQETMLSLRGKIRWQGDLDVSRTGRQYAGDH
jgi:Arc/MetJ family transcription regulator